MADAEKQSTEAGREVDCVATHKKKQTFYDLDLHSDSSVDKGEKIILLEESDSKNNLHHDAPLDVDTVKHSSVLTDDNNDHSQSNPSLSTEDLLISEDHCPLRSIALQELNASFVFQLMTIVSDKQELGFVEKVHVLQDQILKLCNHLAPVSVDHRIHDARINFETLNDISLPTVGCYGDKSMLAKMLRKLKAISDDIYLKLLSDGIEAGLYAAPMWDCILIFYWHQGNRMEEAARKNISCNFIRYLVDLCDTVFLFVEEENVFDALHVSSTIRHSKQQRTKRLKVFQVQNSANDVTLSPGFEISTQTSSNVALPKKFQDMINDTPFFCHGNHRCAFLFPVFKESYVYKKAEDICARADILVSRIKDWGNEYNLDFSALKNDDFAVLIKYCDLPEFEEYRQFECLTRMKQEEEEKKLNVATLISDSEEKVMTAFLSVLPEICNVLQYLPGWEHGCSYEVISASDPFELLEQTLTTILKGKKLLFVGSELKIGSSFRCLIKHLPGTPSPISFGGKFMLMSDDSEYQAFFTKQGSTKGLVLSGDNVCLFDKNEKSSRFPRVQGHISEVHTSGEAIRMWIQEIFPPFLFSLNENFRFLLFLMSEGVIDHIRKLGDDFMGALFGEKIGEVDQLSISFQKLIMDFFDYDDNSNQVKSLNVELIREFLLHEDTNKIMAKMDLAASKLQLQVREEISLLKEQLSAFTLDENTIKKGQDFVQDWKALCVEISTYLKSEVKDHILPFWRKNVAHYLQNIFEDEVRVRRRALSDSFKEEKNSFLQQLKFRFQGDATVGSRRRMLIRGCRVNNSYLSRVKSFCSMPTELQVMVTKEEVEKPKIQWKIVELVPRKKDLEELCLNSMHTIKPLCSSASDFISMDPEIEHLKLVVFLKSGELIIFLLAKDERRLDLYLSPTVGFDITGSNPIRTFRRGFDLLAFEESTRYLALYDSQTLKISLFRFDERFRHVDWTGVELLLDIFSGSGHIKWMRCVPGKAELILVDDTNRIRIAELHHQPLMKPRHLFLPAAFISGCISEDGVFLFVLLKTQTYETDEGTKGLNFPKIFVYLVGDDLQFIKSIELGTNVTDETDLELKLVYYVNQIHLVTYTKSAADVISSYVLKITSASKVLHFQEMLKSDGLQIGQAKAEKGKEKSCSTLDYIYFIYDKFAIHPSLFGAAEKNQSFHVYLKSDAIEHDKFSIQKCKDYLMMLLSRIEKEKGKEFGDYHVEFNCHLFEDLECHNAVPAISGGLVKAMGNWMMHLLCLVPIQICRANNNGVQPLVNGLQIPSNISYADSISLANLLRFGMYDSILSQWDGIIKVISSMGKQSSGKSYLLNHLSGSLLDVAGGRCTDGVWMTVRIHKDCLYVLLDFEGLGSFERTEQEDMLLSVLNAAMSNLTIFNKKDFHLDKETEAVFNRFQDGVSIVKSDEKLFKGLFYIAIKDVDAADVEELKEEFHKKLYQICQRSKENFLTKMYNGEVEICAMPPFTREEYHKDSLLGIAATVDDLEHSYHGGKDFLRDLKLVIAQIAAKDWTPVDIKRVAMKIDILRKNISSAVNVGCLVSNEPLRNFDAEDEIADEPLEVGDLTFSLPDTGMELGAEMEDYAATERILGFLRQSMDQVLRRSGNDTLWHTKFVEFLHAVAKRRQDRVKMWIECNVAEFGGHNEAQKLQLEASLSLAELKQGLDICGSKCRKCFWKCVLHKGHASDHSCMGDHVCTEKCSYCSMESNQSNVWECQSLSGHEGCHDCKKMNHTCGKNCCFFEVSSNCSKTCCLNVAHEGSHRCNSPQHLCNKICSLQGCKNSCIIQIETGQHEKHFCQERYCPKRCIMKGCRRRCGHEDHFHQLTSNEHLCGSEHPCPRKCEEDGICEIFTELVKQIRSFKGRRGSFEYEHVSEQNGLRKDCCMPVPAFQLSHEGPHVHTENPDAIHYCDVKCQACGYFCQRPKNHPGLHNTVHGNMRNVSFSSEKEEFDILDRKYAWGESGVAEMCNMHCKAQGRGHLHLIRCPTNDGLVCSINLYDGARHETRKYGPDLDVSKDELVHEAYWKQMRFEDPCTEDDQNEFALCSHLCISDEHVGADGIRAKSYCTEKLWHEPLTAASTLALGGHITQDGHVFSCNHTKKAPHHVIFVIDKSGSMSYSDIMPTMNKFVGHHNCRLGCVYEAILRFIIARRKTCTDDILSVVLFDGRSTSALEMREMREDVVDQLLAYGADGSTSYSSALMLAREILIKGCGHPNYAQMKPVVIFLSDGGNNDGLDPICLVNSILKADSRTILHTIMFGRDPAAQILEKMAQAGNGTFQLSLDEVQLARSFESLAASLKPTVSALF